MTPEQRLEQRLIQEEYYRIQKENKSSNLIPHTEYKGYDPASGNHKLQTLGNNPVAVGKALTNGAIGLNKGVRNLGNKFDSMPRARSKSTEEVVLNDTIIWRLASKYYAFNIGDTTEQYFNLSGDNILGVNESFPDTNLTLVSNVSDGIRGTITQSGRMQTDHYTPIVAARIENKSSGTVDLQGTITFNTKYFPSYAWVFHLFIFNSDFTRADGIFVNKPSGSGLGSEGIDLFFTPDSSQLLDYSPNEEFVIVTPLEGTMEFTFSKTFKLEEPEDREPYEGEPLPITNWIYFVAEVDRVTESTPDVGIPDIDYTFTATLQVE